MIRSNIAEVLHGAPRAEAVRIFRDLADRLERGELQGARVQWREGLGYVETVELDYATGEARLKRIEVEG